MLVGVEPPQLLLAALRANHPEGPTTGNDNGDGDGDGDGDGNCDDNCDDNDNGNGNGNGNSAVSRLESLGASHGERWVSWTTLPAAWGYLDLDVGLPGYEWQRRKWATRVSPPAPSSPEASHIAHRTS